MLRKFPCVLFEKGTNLRAVSCVLINGRLKRATCWEHFVLLMKNWCIWVKRNSNRDCRSRHFNRRKHHHHVNVADNSRDNSKSRRMREWWCEYSGPGTPFISPRKWWTSNRAVAESQTKITILQLTQWRSQWGPVFKIVEVPYNDMYSRRPVGATVSTTDFQFVNARFNSGTGHLVMKHSWAIYGRFCGLTAATGGSIPPLGA